MFTAKDLEVYKDSIKEKKNKAPKAGEKPLTPLPSAVKISKAPSLKLQNEEPLKERKPLSVVHKASNTIKDPHKPPPVGTSMLKTPGVKTKDLSPRTFPPLEANTFVKASDVKREPLESPRETSLPKPSHTKLDDNKVVGVHKLKESSTHGATYKKIPSMSAVKIAPPANATSGVYQKSPSMSAAKVAPPANLNASLCSECTRAASEGAVCFIGNDGRVSACTTRSAVRLCKNLNCAANNPEYVVAMANAPKKYLISKRHSLKAQFGPKSKSGRPKSPTIAQQGGVAGVDGLDSLSPSNGDTCPSMHDVSTDSINNSFSSSVLAPEVGALTPLNGNLRLFDGDMSLIDETDIFCDGEMGSMNDVMRGMACMEDYVAAEEGISDDTDAANEHEKSSFYQGGVGETEPPKFSTSESLKVHIEALSEGKEYNDTKPDADNESSKLENLEELGDTGADGTVIHKGSDADLPEMKASEGANSPSHLGEEVDTNALSVSMGSLIDVSQTDVERGADDGQTGHKLEEDQLEQRHSVTSSDIKQVKDDVTSQQVYKDNKKADSTLIDSSDPVGVHSDSTSSIQVDIAKAHSNQDHGIESNIEDGHNGDTTPFLIRHVADHNSGSDIQLLSVGGAKDDIKSLYNDQSDKETTPKVAHTAGDDHGDVYTSLKAQHMADDDHCNDITSPHGVPLLDGDFSMSLHGMHVADNYEGDNDGPSSHAKLVAPNIGANDTSALSHANKVGEDGASLGLMPWDNNDGKGEGESDEDDNEYETNESETNVCIADNDQSIDQLTMKSWSGEGDNNVTSTKEHRRRRLLNVVVPPNPEMVILRKQQTQGRKQAEEWMLNYAIEGVVHKLAPTGEGKVKILVEAFESIISHTDVDAIDPHNESKEKRTLS